MFNVGAGEAKIQFPKEVFPNPRENYTGVHDDPLAHVLIVDSGERYCFIFLDLVDPGDWDAVRSCAAEELGIPVEQVILHTTHVLSTPHCTKADEISDDAERVRDQLQRQTVLEAVQRAVKQAEVSVVPAQVGVGTTICGLNANRILETKDGYEQGICETGKTDHHVPIICIRDMEGNMLALIYTVNTSGAVLEGSRLADGKRPVSGDIPSGSERILEEQFGTKAIYTTGVTGDQWPVLRAVWEHKGRDGILQTKDYGEQGFLMVELLSRRLAQAVAEEAPKISCSVPKGNLHLEEITLTLPGHEMVRPPQMRELTAPLEFTQSGEVQTTVYLLSLDDTLVIGCEPEICMETADEIRVASPYKNTIIMEFVNGLADYMATEDLYEKAAPQAKKGCFMPGSAELFVTQVLEHLRSV